MMWLTAYARFMAVIHTAESTSKEEATGLAAHQCVILQLHNDLGGIQWMNYDTEFREWAATKDIHVWGSLTLPYMVNTYLKCNLYKCPAYLT